MDVRVGEAVTGVAAPAYGTPRSPPSRTASARATRSSSSGWAGSDERGPAWRTSSHPRGAVIRPAWLTHKSQECGSRDGRQRTDDCRRVRVDERQGRHGVVRAPGPATATGNVHDRKAIARKRRRSAGHAQLLGPRCATVTIGAWVIRAAPREVIGSPTDRLRAEPGLTDSSAGAAICAARCCPRPCRAGAAAPSGSTWRCWRPTNPSSGAGRTGWPNSTSPSTRFRASRPRIPTACSGHPR